MPVITDEVFGAFLIFFGACLALALGSLGWALLTSKSAKKPKEPPDDVDGQKGY